MSQPEDGAVILSCLGYADSAAFILGVAQNLRKFEAVAFRGDHELQGETSGATEFAVLLILAGLGVGIGVLHGEDREVELGLPVVVMVQPLAAADILIAY